LPTLLTNLNDIIETTSCIAILLVFRDDRKLSLIFPNSDGKALRLGAV